VAIVGHSRGGILGRAVAARLGERASHLILLGSPVGAIERWSGWPEPGRTSHRSVADAGNRVRNVLDPDCSVPHCGCPFPADLRRPLSPATNVVSIYSENDPVVPAWTCPIPGARNVKISGTHTGLVYNGGVYRALASALT
jgi:pimeloyl-ACP methyl ester carboxylesterase